MTNQMSTNRRYSVKPFAFSILSSLSEDSGPKVYGSAPPGSSMEDDMIHYLKDHRIPFYEVYG